MASPPRRTEIQWLRALAASEVVFCHSDLVTKHFTDFRLIDSWWYKPLEGIGVEIFFMVSGYVICMRAPTHATGGTFLLSRIRRLFPMYWIFTTLVVLTYLANPDWRLANFGLGLSSLLKSYLILPQMGFPILGVGWTLEHEMIFYGFVALMMTFWGMSASVRMAVAWCLATMGFLGCLHGPEPGPSVWTFHIFSPYMFAFGFGWLIRCVEEMSPHDRLRNVALFVAMECAAYVIGTDYGDRLMLRVIFAASVFTAFIGCRRYFEATTMLGRIGWRLGDASYSIYLSHWFVLSAIGKGLGILQPPAMASGPVRLLGIAVSIVVGLGIYAALEKPIDRWLRHGSLPEFRWPPATSLRWENVSRFFS